MVLFLLTNYKRASDLSVRVSSDFWVTKPIMELLVGSGGITESEVGAK